jgi:hypothetical protein
VTCGIGANDILYTAPSRLFADLRTLLATLPDQTVVLDLPLPGGLWGVLGRFSVPYVARINRSIHQQAGARGLPVAEVSTSSPMSSAVMPRSASQWLRCAATSSLRLVPAGV